MDAYKYLLVGNGIAGHSAAKEIRENDKEGSILMVSEESYLTYYRPRLSEYLSKQFDDEELLVKKDSWYDERKIDVLLNRTVVKIDIDKNKVQLDGGREIIYEKLLIATGSRPFIPLLEGKSKEGVMALRSLKDLHYIKRYFSECNDVAVVGGGLLGLEAAWSLKELGKNVSIIEYSSHLLSKQLDEEISQKLEIMMSNEGFKVYLSSSAEKILGNSRVEGVVLNGNRAIKTDGILFSTGIVPNVDLVRDTQVRYNRGIIVDEHLKTNIGNICAAGDVIEKDGIIMGLWPFASEQGKIAGANMSGKSLEYNWSDPFTILKLGDIKLFSIGEIKQFDKIHEFKYDEKNIHKKLFTTEDKLTGGILFGDTKDMGKLKKAVIENQDIESYLNK